MPSVIAKGPAARRHPFRLARRSNDLSHWPARPAWRRKGRAVRPDRSRDRKVRCRRRIRSISSCQRARPCRRGAARTFRCAAIASRRAARGSMSKPSSFTSAGGACIRRRRAKVGRISRVVRNSSRDLAGGSLPGHEATNGTRSPPSHIVLFWPRSGALPPLPLPPLSEMNITSVFFHWPA